MLNRKEHWEHIYNTRQPHEVSWTQKVPQTSLDFINELNISKSAPVIDVGGGDSNLVDFMLAEGFSDITVLDISEAALNRAKMRLGEKAEAVTWINCDITDFEPERKYELWHDRAVFHFLIKDDDIKRYQELVNSAVSGYMILATFSQEGPDKCSGLEIEKYSESKMKALFAANFDTIKCMTEDHVTPFASTQNFIFCSFKKRKA